MNEPQLNNPLHGKTLESILVFLVDRFGWEDLGEIIAINCFRYDPSIKSSLAFLRKTPWARKKVEDLYLDSVITDKERNLTSLFGNTTDLTERKEAEEEIEKQNIRFELIARTTNDSLMELDIETGKVWQNERHKQFYGAAFLDVTSFYNEWVQHIHPHDKEKTTASIEETKAAGKNIWTGEYRFKAHDGSWLTIYDRTYIVYNKQGKAIKEIGSMTDITERKKTEEELRESDLYLRGILDSTDDGILAVGNNGKVINSNNRFAELWRIPNELMNSKEDQALQAHVLDQLVDPNAFFSKVQELYKSDRTDFDILQFKDGRIFERYSTPLLLHKNIVGRVWSFRDITKQKKAEESLRLAEERYRNIFENALNGIFQSTPGGQFLMANPSMVKMFGFDSEEDMITSVTNIGAQLYDNPQQQLQQKEQLAKQGKLSGLELRAVKKNQERIWVQVNIQAMHVVDGKAQYYEGTIEDITGRKLAEEKLAAQIEELKKTNSELDRFVYSTSHDLRAPLASILGVVNIAELENPSDTQKQYLEIIRNSTNRLDGFIKDILDYSRNARLNVQPERVNFHELIAEAQENIKFMGGTEQLKVTIEIDDRTPFYSDSSRISMVFKNLFANSIKYQDVNKSSYLLVNIVTHAESARITFKDNGIGIEARHLGKIFDMFYRATDKSKGSGLGLYIVKETITKLGGTINVESEFGVFTTIEVEIPSLKRIDN